MGWKHPITKNKSYPSPRRSRARQGNYRFVLLRFDADGDKVVYYPLNPPTCRGKSEAEGPLTFGLAPNEG